MTDILNILVGQNMFELGAEPTNSTVASKQANILGWAEQNQAHQFPFDYDLNLALQNGQIIPETHQKANVVGSQLELCVATAVADLIIHGIPQVTIDYGLTISGPEYDGNLTDNNLDITPIITRKLATGLAIQGDIFVRNNFSTERLGSILTFRYEK